MRLAIAASLLGVLALSGLALQQVSAFRTRILRAAEEEQDRSAAEQLLAELLELENSIRAFRLTGDRSLIEPMLAERARRADALSRSEPLAKRPPLDEDDRRNDEALAGLRAFVDGKLRYLEELERGGRPRVSREALKRHLADDEKMMRTARGLLAGFGEREWSPAGRGLGVSSEGGSGGSVLAVIAALGGASLLAVLVGYGLLLAELRLRRKVEARLIDAERGLRRSRDELEDKVRERTAELLRSEESLRQAQKMEAIGRLAGGVAHDFNNILTVVEGYATFLAKSPDASTSSDARQIVDMVKRAASLTRQLLQFARRQPPGELRSVDLNVIVRSAERLLARLIGEDIRLEVKLDPGAPWVRALPADLDQVLMNLALNARDAMPRGGRLSIETATIDLSDDPTLSAGRYAEVSVVDEGVGVGPDLRERIFEPFFTTKEPGRGTGLGLATVYAIAHRLGGAARVESEPGRGAAFRVLLPLAAPHSEEEAVPEGGEAGLRGSGTVLLVEDEKAILRLFSRALSNAGYQVIAASDAPGALREAADVSRPIDVLLSDVVMPGMRGTELAAKLSARRPGLKVILISGYVDDAALAFLPERVELLVKPVSPERVVAAVASALRKPPTAD